MGWTIFYAALIIFNIVCAIASFMTHQPFFGGLNIGLAVFNIMWYAGFVYPNLVKD